MAKVLLSDEEVEAEIERLLNSPFVKLSKREYTLRKKRQQYMYNLRTHERRGKELAAKGYTLDNLEELLAQTEAEASEDA